MRLQLTTTPLLYKQVLLAVPVVPMQRGSHSSAQAVGIWGSLTALCLSGEAGCSDRPMLLKVDGKTILQSSTISCPPASFTFFCPVPCHSTLEIWICLQALASFNPCLFQAVLTSALIIKPSLSPFDTLCFPVPWLPLKLSLCTRTRRREDAWGESVQEQEVPHCNISGHHLPHCGQLLTPINSLLA